MVLLRSCGHFSRSAVFASASLVASVVVLGLAAKEEPSLAAAGRGMRTDLDRDGLSDQQELVIGTHPYRRDTDGDTYSDLDERARGSDPRDHTSMPEPADYGAGMCASQDNAYITAVCCLYVKEALIPSMELKVGLVHRGKVFKFSPHDIANARGYLFRGRDPGDKLAIVEIRIPMDLVRRLGQVNLFSVLSSSNPGSEPIVSMLPIVEFSGVAMVIEQRAAGISGGSGGGATGVTYRPLASNDQIPSTWTSGQICFQGTAAVGVRGASIVHEVGSADCLPMDTYCSPGDCASTVGQPLELPDPAALAGG